jgi:hypothetical protein
MWEHRVEFVRIYGQQGNVMVDQLPQPQELQLLDQLGTEGWELVNAVRVNGGVRLYFKRRRGQQ